MSHIAAIECLLFVAGEPLPAKEIARVLACEELEAISGIYALRTSLAERGSGLQVIEIAGGFQLSTRPEHSETIARLLNRTGSKLSRAALETVAVVAYRQPVTQAEIEAVRGVSCGGVLKTLIDRRLVVETGRRQSVGRPILYATTPEFLHYFALNGLDELPALEEGTGS